MMKYARPMNVLVTCGGKWVSHVLQLREAMSEVPEFRGGKVFVADRERLNPAGAFADESFAVPALDDPEYPFQLLRLCLEHDIRVITPHMDPDVMALAPHRPLFVAEGISVLCPPADVAELCFDKWQFYAWAVAEGIPVPTLMYPQQLAQTRFPVFAKPVRGFGSIGARLCRDIHEVKRVLHTPGMLLQEYVEGPEYSVDAYINCRGEIVVRVPRVREKVVGGEAYRTHTVRDPQVAELADHVLRCLANRGHRGPVNVQIIKANRAVVIDVNPRLGSAVVLPNQATGGRLFRAILEEAAGRVAEGNPDDYTPGLHLWRFLGEFFYSDQGIVRVEPASAAMPATGQPARETEEQTEQTVRAPEAASPDVPPPHFSGPAQARRSRGRSRQS